MNSKALTDKITPLIITFNEAENLSRALNKLKWAKRIVIIDSGSIDGTLDIIAQYPQAEIIYHAFTSFAEQCNFGLAQIRSDWVLSLDADYELSDRLIKELSGLRDVEAVGGYRASFVYRIHGRPLRGTLYPPRMVLYRVQNARYTNEGHGHKVVVSGGVRKLSGVIFHDDRKPLSRWFMSQQGYARLEADHLLEADAAALAVPDRLRRMAWPAPIIVFFYVLLIKGCLLDGWPGWFYALQRLLAECMIALELIDCRVRRAASRENNRPGPGLADLP